MFEVNPKSVFFHIPWLESTVNHVRRDVEQEEEQTETLQVAAATGSGERRLDKFTALPMNPVMKQDVVKLPWTQCVVNKHCSHGILRHSRLHRV